MTQSYQTQYANILQRLLNNPKKERPSRVGDVYSNFVELIRVDLEKEFPLMDLKKIKFSNILHELLWFIRGDTHIQYLIENGCNIWTDDAYRYYKEKFNRLTIGDITGELFNESFEELTKEEFIQKAKEGHAVFGELDRIYGKQWRHFNHKTDQLQNCINTLLTNPDDRRMIVSAHNPTDLEEGIVGLPSCHNMFQFYTMPMTIEERRRYWLETTNSKYEMKDFDTEEEEQDNYDFDNVPRFKLNLWFNVRSQDMFLGNPYNVASYALLNYIVANIVNMVPSEVVCTAIDCHLYKKHIPAAEEWLKRHNEVQYESKGRAIGSWLFEEKTFCKSILKIKRKLTSIDDVKADDFELLNYNPQSYIKAPLLT